MLSLPYLLWNYHASHTNPEGCSKEGERESSNDIRESLDQEDKQAGLNQQAV